MDPLNVAARSQELALLSRVADVAPGVLDELLYQERLFFDWGGTVFITPMEELPYWRAIMQRKAQEPRWTSFAAGNPQLIDYVRREIQMRGPLGNRDFDGRSRVTSYRARKDTGLALYYLWLVGDLMTHHRRRYERLLDLRSNVAPAEHDWEASLADAERFLVRKQISFVGMCRMAAFGGLLERRVDKQELAKWRDAMLANGEITEVALEGRKDLYYLLTRDLPELEMVAAGQTPPAWQPIGPTTLDEVSFLAPLEIVSARGRAKVLFEFDYVWEVYKPAAQRRWGYYTLPVLYGDRLVARLDPRLDRKTNTLHLLGFWLEDEVSATDPAFAAALAGGINRLACYVGAQRIDPAGIEPSLLRTAVSYSPAS